MFSLSSGTSLAFVPDVPDGSCRERCSSASRSDSHAKAPLVEVRPAYDAIRELKEGAMFDTTFLQCP